MCGVPLAHSDYDDATDWRDTRANAYYRPPHAAEGAYALVPTLATLLPSLVGHDHLERAMLAMLSAVARHHAGHAATLRPFQLIAHANNEVQHVVRTVGEDVPVTLAEASVADCSSFDRLLIRANDHGHADWLTMYWFLARRVRLADQAATAGHAQREGECA